jgi:hypothetical protein
VCRSIAPFGHGRALAVDWLDVTELNARVDEAAARLRTAFSRPVPQTLQWNKVNAIFE